MGEACATEKKKKERKKENKAQTSGGLGTDVRARELLLEQVLNEGGLSGGVLSEQEHHGLGIKVCVAHDRGVEVGKAIQLLHGLDLPLIDLLEPIHHRVHILGTHLLLSSKHNWLRLKKILGRVGRS